MTTNIERIARNFFDEVIGELDEPIYNFRPDWLKNEKTGRNFEIDIFYPNLKLAIEINGIFHTLKRIRERDKWKFNQCKKLRIWYYDIRKISDFWRFLNQFERELKIKVNLSNEIKIDLLSYQPDKKAFQKPFERAKRIEKYHDHYDPIFEAYKKEREMNKARILRRQNGTTN